METANLAIFLKFGNANKSHICVIFAKNMGGHETGGLERSRPKTATGHNRDVTAVNRLYTVPQKTSPTFLTVT